MSPKPIDLVRAKRALEKLDAAFEEHPELREPEAMARLGAWLQEEEQREMAADEKSRARLQRLREKRRQAGWMQYELWLPPDAAALLTQLQQPEETPQDTVVRALRALQATAPRKRNKPGTSQP